MSSLFKHIRMHWIGFNSFKHSYNWYSNFGVFLKIKTFKMKKKWFVVSKSWWHSCNMISNEDKVYKPFYLHDVFPSLSCEKTNLFFYCTWKIFMVIFQVCHIKLVSIKWKENQLPVTSVYKFTDELPAIDMHLVIYIW